MATPIRRPGIMIGSVINTRMPPRFLMSGAHQRKRRHRSHDSREQPTPRRRPAMSFVSASRIDVIEDNIAYQSVVNPAIGNPTQVKR